MRRRFSNRKLYALDLLTGQDRIAPTRIEVDLLPGRPGIAFSPKFNLNRPGLLLQNGVVYLAFGSHDDNGDYCGWILAYDAKMLKQLAAYNTTPDWGEGGIWQSGTGLAGDGECVYAVVGNGKETGDRTPPNPVTKPEYGNALLKLKLDATAGVLKIVDWFTTKNVFAQNDDDVDLIGGPVLFEAETGPKGERRSFLLGGGKDGHFYLAYRDKLGCWTPDNSGILQAKQLCEYHIHGAPVVWSSGRGNTFAYVWSERDALKSFKLGSQGFGPPRQFSEVRFPVMEDRMPGGILTLSWDGTDPESAILWASHPTRENAMNKTVAGTLRAFKATDLTRELWNSDMDPAGDDRIGSFAKFSPAVVANGRVYIGTFSRELAVYGLLDEPRFDMGDFELRNIGDVDKLGSYAAGRYVLKLGGAGIGVLPEGFLFANREHNLADSDLKLTARFVGFNVDHLATPARAGLLVRDGFEAGKGAMVALVIDRDGHAFVLARDQPDKPDSKSPAKKVRKIGRTRMPGAPTNLRLIVADAGDKGNVRVTAEVGKALVGEWEVLTDFVMKWDVASNAAVKFGMFATEQNHGAEPRPASAPPGQAKFSKVEFPGA